MIEVKHLEKYYGSDGTVTKALDDISFISYDGEFLCIMGASGSGKSTLLNCLSTIDCASAGDILFNGVSFDSLKKSELAAFRRHNLGYFSELQFAGYPYFRREYIFKFTHQRCCSRHNPKAHS